MESTSATPDGDRSSDSDRPLASVRMPEFSAQILPTLRLLGKCPICLAQWPTLKLQDEARGEVVEVVRKVRKSKASATSTTTPKAVPGPARRKHLTLCALRSRIGEKTVMTLIEQDVIAHHKQVRERHIESEQGASMWDSIVGDAPPSTQIQLGVMQRRRQGRHSFYIETYVSDALVKQRSGVSASGDGLSPRKKQKQKQATKAKTTPKRKATVRRKSGARGGIDRATTTIIAPQRRSLIVKERCRQLFGTIDENTLDAAGQRGTLSAQDAYDYAEDAIEMPFVKITPSQRYASLRRGLGIGACCITNDAENMYSAEARLGMGKGLAGVLIEMAKKNH